MTEDKHPATSIVDKEGRRTRWHVSWREDDELVVVKEDLGPSPPPPPPLTPEEVAERRSLCERMDAFLRDLDSLTRKHRLALGNSCGIYPIDDEPGHYSVREGFLGSNMLGARWVGIDVTWNEGEPDGERVEMRDDDDYKR